MTTKKILRSSKNVEQLYANHLRQTLLGRLRLKMFELITGKKGVIPSESEAKHFVLQLHRKQPEYSKVLIHLGGINKTRQVQYNNLQQTNVVLLDLLKSLEYFPWAKPKFIEIDNCPSPYPQKLGVLIFCEELEGGGKVYVVNVIGERCFPKLLIARLEVRVKESEPEPFVSLLENGDFWDYSLVTWRQRAIVEMSIKCLQVLHTTREIVPIPIDNSVVEKSESLFDSPEDPLYVNMVEQVKKGYLSCIKTNVCLSHIRPYHFKFCMIYPLEFVEPIIHEIREGHDHEMLVYWDGKHYVMSDDYAIFLAYRALRRNEVPVIVMGNIPHGIDGERGGRELLPPGGKVCLFDYNSVSESFREWMLDNRLQSYSDGTKTGHLYKLILTLHILLSDPCTKERQIHDLIRENPIIMDPSGIRLFSEVRLGNDYRVDLIIQLAQSDKELLLVELERPSLSIFTNKGRLRAHVGHALQQVEDWLRWWHEYPTELPHEIDASILPEGLVVIGRSIAMTNDQKKRLQHLNANRKVKVITYDDLAERLERLITNLSI